MSATSITWGRNSQGRLVPMAVSYGRLVVEETAVTRRDIRASTAESEVSRITLPRISLPAVEVPKPLRRAPAPPPRQASAIDRVELIRTIHRRMKREGRIADRGLVEEIRAGRSS